MLRKPKRGAGTTAIIEKEDEAVIVDNGDETFIEMLQETHREAELHRAMRVAFVGEYTQEQNLEERPESRKI